MCVWATRHTELEVSDMVKPNQDIRDYMADHGVTQKDLAAEVGLSVGSICMKMKTELSQKDKDVYLNLIDAIAQRRDESFVCDEPEDEPAPVEEEGTEDVSCSPKFNKVPAKADKIGTVSDIWSSLAKASVMYAVEDESGHCGLYAEDQLEPAPLPIQYTFSAIVENNVAVVCMIATQGGKSWVYARGHAHILHDGAVGEAQAVSYAARRMFASLDTKQEKPIYFKQER